MWDHFPFVLTALKRPDGWRLMQLHVLGGLGVHVPMRRVRIDTPHTHTESGTLTREEFEVLLEKLSAEPERISIGSWAMEIQGDGRPGVTLAIGKGRRTELHVDGAPETPWDVIPTTQIKTPCSDPLTA